MDDSDKPPPACYLCGSDLRLEHSVYSGRSWCLNERNCRQRRKEQSR